MNFFTDLSLCPKYSDTENIIRNPTPDKKPLSFSVKWLFLTTNTVQAVTSTTKMTAERMNGFRSKARFFIRLHIALGG